MHQHLAVVRLLDEVIQHLLGDFEIGDHAIFHGLDGDDVAGSASQHFLGFFAYRLNFTSIFIDGDDGRFIHHNAFALGIDKRVGRPQVNGKIAGEHAEE